MLKFYRLTGDTKFLARIPEVARLARRGEAPRGCRAVAGGRTHPTFVELGTNQPLYVHRDGSNVVNGEYYVDRDPRKTLAHYGSFRQIDVARLRRDYLEAKALSPESLQKASPLAAAPWKATPLPRYFVADSQGSRATTPERVAIVVASLDEQGRWLSELGSTSHPYRGDGPREPAPGDFSQTQVGDETDTSPYRVEHLLGHLHRRPTSGT